MGQQASAAQQESIADSAASDVAREAAQPGAVVAVAPTWGRLACWSAEALPKADRATETVVFNSQLRSEPEELGAVGSRGSLEVRQREVLRQKPLRPPCSTGWACGIGLPKGPSVEVTDVRSTSATVRWVHDGRQAPRKFHIDVVGLVNNVDADVVEMAFFEAAGEERSFELPAGSLPRASGPFQVRVMAEVGPADRSSLTPPGTSAAFSTDPEAPGSVVMLRLAGESQESTISVRWEQPIDDGGAAITMYEVTVEFPPKDQPPPLSDGLLDLELPEATVVEAEKLVTKEFRTTDCSFELGDLPPGTGPYRVRVRATNAAALTGLATSLDASTAWARPAVPTQLRARLLPAHMGASGREGFKLRLPRRTASVDLGMASDDVDVVRLEFRAPATNGGRDVSAYMVHAVEDRLDDGPADVLDAEKASGQVLEPLATFLAEECGGGPLGALCSCDIAVGPNRAYTFFVEAHNGALASGLSDPSCSVFLPARVPLPPRGPPEVFRVQGGFAAELRWVGPLTGGGLPLLSWKLGVLGPGGLGETGAESVGAELAREVTISALAALAAAKDASAGINWQSPASLAANEAIYAARVEGLQAEARYCFVLAASNAMGTGRWSTPSNPMITATGVPPAPINAVATICVDDKQRVVITVTWESGRVLSGGSGSAPAAYHVMLVPAPGVSSSASASSSSCAAAETVLRERIPVTSRLPGQRFSWAAPLQRPGGYTVEVMAENASGQRSPPAQLSLDVRPEVFPLRDEDNPQPAPRWAEEPVLVLGPAASSEDTRFGEFEEAGTWLQALLLWHDDDPNLIVKEANGVQRMSSGRLDSGIDVVAFYRRTGSSASHAAVLGAGVTASRLQVALPSHVPLSLRLIKRTEPVDLAVAVKPNSYRSAKVRSEPMLLMMSDQSEHLRPSWEVWARQTLSGPPRWTELPDFQNNVLEVAWLEDGSSKAHFEISGATGTTGTCTLPPGQYEMTFGDERLVQHTVRRLGVGGWTARARRIVKDPVGQDAPLPTLSADDQCVICMERRRTHAFMHADTGDGHLAVCGECAGAYRAEAAAAGAARAVRTCPMCRRGYSAVQRIYQ